MKIKQEMGQPKKKEKLGKLNSNRDKDLTGSKPILSGLLEFILFWPFVIYLVKKYIIGMGKKSTVYANYMMIRPDLSPKNWLSL